MSPLACSPRLPDRPRPVRAIRLLGDDDRRRHQSPRRSAGPGELVPGTERANGTVRQGYAEYNSGSRANSEATDQTLNNYDEGAIRGNAPYVDANSGETRWLPYAAPPEEPFNLGGEVYVRARDGAIISARVTPGSGCSQVSRLRRADPFRSVDATVGIVQSPDPPSLCPAVVPHLAAASSRRRGASRLGSPEGGSPAVGTGQTL
jgi:hypothetical protein